MRQFRANPARPGELLWRQSNARSIGAGFLACFLFALGLGGCVALLGAAFGKFDPVARVVVLAILLLVTWLLFSLAWLCWRQARGQFGLRITLGDAEITLHLPRDRSLVHHPPAVSRTIPAASIAQVYAREEAFSSQLMAMLQRTYWLQLTGGEWVLLFEDRALDTPYATGSLMPIAETVAQRFGLAVTALPLVEGKGGMLGAWWVEAPPRDAPPVPAKRQALLKRRVMWTGSAGLIAAIVAVIAMVFG